MNTNRKEKITEPYGCEGESGVGYRMNAYKQEQQAVRGPNADAAYYRHRDYVFSEKMRRGKTQCPYCEREMFFNGMEPWDRFSDRHWEQHKAPPSKWPKDIQQQKATLDHLLPISRGGTDRHRNLTTMCGECNQDKGRMTPPEWIEKRELLGHPLSEVATARLLKRWRKCQRRI